MPGLRTTRTFKLPINVVNVPLLYVMLLYIAHSAHSLYFMVNDKNVAFTS